MASSSGELKPSIMSIEELKEQIAVGKQLVTTVSVAPPSPPVFHGIIYELLAEEEDDDDDVEKDGGGMSRHKTHQNVSPSSKGHKSSTMVIKRKHEAIKIRNVPPDFSLPGRMYVSETGQTIEFYYGRDILEATDAGVVVTEPVIEGPKQEAKFTLVPKAKEGDSYKLINEIDCCICLTLEKSQPQLVSLTNDEIKERDITKIVQYITIFQSSNNLLALFFTHQTSSNQIINYYLKPNHTPSNRASSVDVISKDITHKSDDEQIEIHRKFLFFSNNPQTGEDSTDHSQIHHQILTSHGNRDSTLSLESSDESRDSGCGQSVKD